MMTQSIMSRPIPLRFKVDDYYKMIKLGMLEDYKKADKSRRLQQTATGFGNRQKTRRFLRSRQTL
jgi:hypothetical protein